MPVAFACVVLVILFPSDLYSQTKWFKYEGNPVLDVGQPGSWKDAGVTINRVIFKDSIYHAWHSANDGTYRRIGHAVSSDGIHWTFGNFGKPVLEVGADGAWDQREATVPYIAFFHSKYHMWYHGFDGFRIRIGYASSLDGIVWTKADNVNPVLTFGPSAWDGHYVGFPSILGPDSTGKFKMWYSGNADPLEYHIQIGYAEGANPISWKKHHVPVVTKGTPGSWDDRTLLFPRVLYHGQVYEMWYAGSRGTASNAQTGYATSFDGVHWTKSAENPVLLPGPAGSWDDEAARIGDILFDGTFYRMWYGGHDGSVGRTGYAVSPKGANVYVSANRTHMFPQKDSVFVRVCVDDPTDLLFSSEFKSGDGKISSRMELFDDGEHGDSLSGDGLFANRWLPTAEGRYSVGIKLNIGGKAKRGYILSNAAIFTTIGPLKLDKVMFLNSGNPNPGDTVLVKLVIRNHGPSALADSVSASMFSTDALISSLNTEPLSHGTIQPGSTVTTSGYYRLFISPNCPSNTDIPIDIAISSAGIPFWRDTFVITVLPPWWRTNWAYGIYVFAAIGLLYGLRKAEMRRVQIKHHREMEHFQIEKLKEVDQLKSRFFANISHEFRTPLTLIQGPAAQIASGGDKEDSRELAGMIMRNSERLLRLVNQLLDLSKIESGQMRLHVRRMNIVEVVKEVAASFESLAKQKGIEFLIASKEDLIDAWLDRDAVVQIVTNLLSNAFKFTSSGGSVRTAVGRNVTPSNKASVEITVSDTGIGIPDNRREKIFDRFYQVDDTHTREHEGTGIGLALTKELVEAHRGTIEVRSKEGRGSAFVVRLPVGKENYRPDEIVEEPIEGKKGAFAETVGPLESKVAEVTSGEDSRPLVLIIEDNADMRRYIQTHLEGNYRSLQAVNGEEGIEKAIEEIPDIVISDVMMPRTDGFELCRRLKTDDRTSHIPVILLTAKAGSEHKIEGLETGADDYLVKPFDAKELLVRVRNLIEQRRKLRERFQRELVVLPKDVNVKSVDEKFLTKVLAVVESHLSDPNFDTTAFAEEAAMSRMQLHRKLRALTNLGPGELIRSFRMKHAASLLQKKAGNISEIAYEVGYNNPSHFAHVFKEHFGQTPSEFISRRQNLQS